MNVRVDENVFRGFATFSAWHTRARAADMLASVSARPSPAPAPSPRPARQAKRAPVRRESLSTRRGSTLSASASTSVPASRYRMLRVQRRRDDLPVPLRRLEVLSELGLLTPDTPVAGASAGALVAAMHACGMPPSEGKRVLTAVLRDCRENGVLGRVGGVLETALRSELPADAHELCSRDNLFVSVSSPRLARGRDVEEGPSVAGFNGGPLLLENALSCRRCLADDLIEQLLSSCHIPVYCSWPMRRYRGKWCVDGAGPTSRRCSRLRGAARVASFPLIGPWRGSPDGARKTSRNYFERGEVSGAAGGTGTTPGCSSRRTARKARLPWNTRRSGSGRSCRRTTRRWRNSRAWAERRRAVGGEVRVPKRSATSGHREDARERTFSAAI